MTQSHIITVDLSIIIYFIITYVVNHAGICLCCFYDSKRTYAPRFSFSCFRAASKQLKQLKNEKKYRDYKIKYFCIHCTEGIPKVTACFNSVGSQKAVPFTIIEKRVFSCQLWLIAKWSKTAGFASIFQLKHTFFKYSIKVINWCNSRK